MKTSLLFNVTVLAALAWTTLPCPAQDIQALPVDTWLTVTGEAAGTDTTARDQALAVAYRKAIERACGVFLTGQTKTRDYQATYDKIFANTVGYIVESKEPKFRVAEGITFVTVTVRVSTQKFEKDWAVIAHTLHQENNPRVIIVISESTDEMVNKMTEENTSLTESTTQVAVEGHRESGSAYSGQAYSQRDTETWTDERGNFWYWRNGHAYRQDNRAASVEEVRAAEAHFRTVIDARSRTVNESNRKIWELVAKTVEEKGAVQGKIEDYFLERGVKLMDRDTSRSVNKRDLALAMGKADQAEIRALGAKFDADVIIFGSAAAKYSREVDVGDAKMHQYTARLAVRAIRTDSGQVLASKVFGPATYTSMSKSGGEQKALEKLADENAPKLLSAIVEAWRRQVDNSRDVRLMVSGMDYDAWKTFKAEAEKLQGMQALRLREITEGLANIDVEYQFSTEILADRLSGMKTITLKVMEINPNRVKLKVAPASTTRPERE